LGRGKATNDVLSQRDERGDSVAMTEEERKAIVSYRQEKAAELLHAVDVLIQNELWNSAVNRMYYACFHCVSALLIQHHIETKSHSGVRTAFALNFVKTGKISADVSRVFAKLYDKRQASDYDDFAYFTREEVEAWYPQVNQFLWAVNAVINEKLSF
jgi:uncharacterized protein (UPF0332 family)